MQDDFNEEEVSTANDQEIAKLEAEIEREKQYLCSRCDGELLF